MNGQLPQGPQNWWQATLTTFLWACRIPVACFLVVAACCLGFLGIMFLVRLTVWAYEHGLAHKW